METGTQALNASSSATWIKMLTDGGTLMVTGASEGLQMTVNTSDSNPGASADYHVIPSQHLNGLNAFVSWPSGSKVWLRSNGDGQTITYTRTAQS